MFGNWISGLIKPKAPFAPVAPGVPIADQSTQALHWGHADFHKLNRQDGTWVLHGHNIIDAPTAVQGRIAIDTGAYATDCLTAALVTDDGVEFEAV